MDLIVIPARGGSKRIPRKNVRLFSGRPIISWSIEAALSSKCSDLVIVSTDDDEIANIAYKEGATVPFIRPKDISNDLIPPQVVINHTIDWAINQGFSIDSVCMLFATAPFVRSSDIATGKNNLKNNLPGSFVFVATKYLYPIQRAIRIDCDGSSSMLNPELFNTRSQDLEEIYHDAGQFYWASTSTWRDCKNLFNQGKPIIIPPWRVQDIDTEDDWKRAEIMHSALKFSK